MSQSLHHQEANPGAILQDRAGTAYIFNPEALEIMWGKDKRFWRINKEVAELIQVYWLEVTGKKEVISSGTWKVKFTVSFNPDAFGWNGTTVMLLAKVGQKGKYEQEKIALGSSNYTTGSEGERRVLKWSKDIKVAPDQRDRTIYFGLYETWSGKWKGGLKIHSASLEKIG